MMDGSRRNFLKTTAGAAGLCVIGASAITRAVFAEESMHSAAKLEPFPLASVRLLPGIFHDQEEINARYLDSLPVDRLLHTFRLTAGITSSATPYKGWEDPTCELRGHFAGGHIRGIGDSGRLRGGSALGGLRRILGLGAAYNQEETANTRRRD